MGHHDEKEDKFSESGPKHLSQTEIDWDNKEHRRCITASLVKGTYVLETDRNEKRENALAPAWWEKFHFRKLPEYELEHACRCAICNMKRHISGSRSGDWLIYGAVFEYAPPAGVPRHPSAPSHIVAFRGTTMRYPTVLSDLVQDLRILTNKQHTCSRFTDARENVQRLVETNGRGGEIWLAGHSLGASIALDVGRDMMINHGGLNLPTFLFNPPHVSLAPAIGEEARTDVCAVGYFLKYALNKVIPGSHMDHMEDVFEKLTTYVPNVYVNPLDDVCVGYIYYFEQRERMMHRLPSSVATVASKLSFRDMWNSWRGKPSERPHLLPSVVLWKNMRSQQDPHGLRQWYQPKGQELDLWTKEYRFGTSSNGNVGV